MFEQTSDSSAFLNPMCLVARTQLQTFIFQSGFMKVEYSLYFYFIVYCLDLF
jgi:hypothetical protein